MKPNKVAFRLGFVPQTPLASPKKDAQGTSRETVRAQWLPNLRWFWFLALTQAYWQLLNDHSDESDRTILGIRVLSDNSGHLENLTSISLS
ncbi:hypothetical protein PQG02_21400 [Nostoc sp. UHCC 0926]|uniref:hypothetical protein n=1 Tax=unclassified Nostoc TaxID=2593658 RepID=UPI0023630D64|nr:hypothetical protein [Nostoc sp. UHCC 0926]WDD31263.1 hypothetical protein PQG02_21400 [Nostoc sp. UHCC 0926]